ncbi:MAG: hypothetical protein RMJ53_02765 [Chitinophagales bacterium]|nr:hypothetical protein [Chitinophagales bacterium]
MHKHYNVGGVPCGLEALVFAQARPHLSLPPRPRCPAAELVEAQRGRGRSLCSRPPHPSPVSIFMAPKEIFQSQYESTKCRMVLLFLRLLSN